MSGSNNANAHPNVEAAYLGICFFPFLSREFLQKVRDSLPSRPFVETKKGEKCRRCSRQASRYFFFLSLS
jgi:hypothetical protein